MTRHPLLSSSDIQLRGLVSKIRNSSTLLPPTYKARCGSAGLTVRKIRLNCKTRWSSTYDMLRLAILYRPVLDDMTGDHALGLRAFELNDDEWSILVELSRVLKVRLPLLLQDLC